MTKPRPSIVFSLALAACLLAGGCESTPEHARGQDMKSGAGTAHLTKAVAVLVPTEWNRTHGVVTFEETTGGVKVVADVYGLEPNSTHAWHVHEWGDVRAKDGTATGGHYNPAGHDHGLPAQAHRHAGDLGNLVADETGHAHREITVSNCTIGGPMNPIIGRGLIVHAKMDDGGQPTGNAGARIAQGVIGVAR